MFMDKIVAGFLERNLCDFKNNIDVDIVGGAQDCYTISANKGRVFVRANNYISAFTGIYDYLKKYCGVQLSWCGNRKIRIKELAMFDGTLSRTIEQKFRVYMNYCTLDYSMCWWDFERWEQEIDFMAMNGINMPLAVIGTEAVWFELLLDYGFTEREALDWVSGPAFWAWQLMTNIEGYLPPPDKAYVYHRLELGRKILERCAEFGMQPIQQGFSGHVPMRFKTKLPNVRILEQRGWCRFPETAQLDPTDPFFLEFGSAYLNKLKELMGNYHYFACDPFHEGTPPKPWFWYLRSVGKTINKMYENFDRESVWVMQTWSMRKHIVKAVPRNRLLLLDIDSEKTVKFRNLWGYQYDLCDIFRQVLSNRFYSNQLKFSQAYDNKDTALLKALSAEQLDILADMDNLLSNRSEFCLSRWIGDSHSLAQSDTEKKYFDLNARALITQWGDINGENILYDYAWREWSGLIKEYYAVRWKLFYDEAISQLEKGSRIDVLCTADFDKRRNYVNTPFGRKLLAFEKQWLKEYKDYAYPVDSDVVPAAKALFQKWKISRL